MAFLMESIARIPGLVPVEKADCEVQPFVQMFYLLDEFIFDTIPTECKGTVWEPRPLYTKGAGRPAFARKDDMRKYAFRVNLLTGAVDDGSDCLLNPFRG